MPATEVKVTIAGPVSVTFNDYSAGTPSYVLRGTPRLLSTLSVRHTETERQGEHGVRGSLPFYGPRTLPFEGEILGSSQSDRKTKEEDLRKCLALPTLLSYSGSDGQLLVQVTDEDGSLKQLYARVIEPPVFDVLDDVDPSRRGFAFVMLAEDPRLHSQTLSSQSGSETYEGTNFSVVQDVSPTVPFSLYQNTPPTTTCVNGGTADAPPVITITGPTTSPKVKNETTGKYVVLTGLTLLAGESVTIDVGKRTIKKNDGTNLSGFWGAGSTWWVLVPGSNLITLLDGTPSLLEATATVQWRDAWL